MMEPDFWHRSAAVPPPAPEIGGAHVQAEHEIEILDLHVNKRRWPIGAGIVDKDVEWLLRGDSCFHGFHVPHVEREWIRLSPAHGSVRRFRDLRRCAAARRHMRASVGRSRGRRQPDAAPGAGDERTPAIEAEEGVFVRSRSSRPPGRRARCGRRSGARGHWPARHAPTNPSSTHSREQYFADQALASSVRTSDRCRSS